MEHEAGVLTVAYPGRRWLELGAAAFFLFYFVTSLLDPVGSGLVRWLLTGAMGINGIHFLRRAADPKPRLVLDEQGIRDRTSITGSELFIPWSEVEAIQPSFGRKLVEVRVLDMGRLCREAGWLRGAWLGLRKLWGKRTIPIFIGLLGVEKDELTAAIEKSLFAWERTRLGFAPDPPKVQPGVG